MKKTTPEQTENDNTANDGYDVGSASYITEPCPCPTCGAQIDRLDPVLVENKELRAIITRAKDALLDGQSTQWVHDLLVTALKPKTDLRALLPELAVIRQVMKETKS
jgi:hypothetical protein